MPYWGHSFCHVGVIVIILVSLLLVGATGGVSGDDAFADDCPTAEPREPGTYSNVLSPRDRDVLRVNISSGDFIAVNLTYEGPNASSLAIYGNRTMVSFTTPNGSAIATHPDIRTRFGRGPVRVGLNGHGRVAGFAVGPGQVQFRVYTEGDHLCLAFQTVARDDDIADHFPNPQGSAAGGAGTWTLSFAINDSEAPVMVSAQELAALRNASTNQTRPAGPA